MSTFFPAKIGFLHLWPDQLSCFDVYWKQTDKQAKKIKYIDEIFRLLGNPRFKSYFWYGSIFFIIFFIFNVFLVVFLPYMRRIQVLEESGFIIPIQGLTKGICQESGFIIPIQGLIKGICQESGFIIPIQGLI